MSEFDVYNNETKEWETFGISQYNKIRADKKYSNFVIDENNI